MGIEKVQEMAGLAAGSGIVKDHDAAPKLRFIGCPNEAVMCFSLDVSFNSSDGEGVVMMASGLDFRQLMKLSSLRVS